MSMIVGVHGVGQQFKGAAIIHQEWWPACNDGLARAKHRPVASSDFKCPFYGDLFRRSGALSAGPRLRVTDVSEEEADVIALLWRAAAESEPTRVPAPALCDSTETTLARAPQMLQRALNALSRSSFWSDVVQSVLLGDVRQCIQYLNDSTTREKVMGAVLDELKPDTRVVIGHSLGSIVAYEALCATPHNVHSFISIGSPLGIRNFVFDKLTPRPTALGVGVWPGKITRWTNVADAGDLVAIQKELWPYFGGSLRDVLVYNGSSPHHGERYLTTREVGEAIAEAI
jgi:pimeloyl-ACP methyl ester carboxylesterase